MDIVVAVDKNWGIGYKGTQTVVIPDDRKHFRDITRHGTVIVGRRTMADFPDGRPLKGRRNIVLSWEENIVIQGAEVAHSVDEALVAVGDDERVFVVGGESIYRAFLPLCDRAFVTKMDASPLADAFFPDLDKLPGWSLESAGEQLDYNGITYQFLTYVHARV